jgi:hypothetical protein
LIQLSPKNECRKIEKFTRRENDPFHAVPCEDGGADADRVRVRGMHVHQRRAQLPEDLARRNIAGTSASDRIRKWCVVKPWERARSCSGVPAVEKSATG